ncbi:unnamed protein product [Strongylus vulgaris]|uniref:Uncharacterized protein n=1 Tax=Strongylus vulgaris TaxID=40348 RepID=A0A3P7L1U4_STRVU|nr:unnamed protein product [Strongylus vulgaris]
MIMVYEVIASNDDTEVRNASVFEDDILYRNGELMDELRRALSGRATEFATRERRALAAFYGISDAELGKLEEEQKNQKPDTDDTQREVIYRTSNVICGV